VSEQQRHKLGGEGGLAEVVEVHPSLYESTQGAALSCVIEYTWHHARVHYDTVQSNNAPAET
jgi:hypothetical protein